VFVTSTKGVDTLMSDGEFVRVGVVDDVLHLLAALGIIGLFSFDLRRFSLANEEFAFPISFFSIEVKMEGICVDEVLFGCSNNI
jgi:hypothetical protein